MFFFKFRPSLNKRSSLLFVDNFGLDCSDYRANPGDFGTTGVFESRLAMSILTSSGTACNKLGYFDLEGLILAKVFRCLTVFCLAKLELEKVENCLFLTLLP